MTLKVAIVGLGHIGNIHAGVYQKHPQVEIVAVCDVLAEKADQAAKQYKCQAFYSVRDLLQSGLTI
ncbi:MAG TPA: Gfo/Idh/MocA family oxidoreductase, partial [Chloroflexota bacterium]|nr:Gfo/Idh/MocA family oxidoreductase [Chloroflexota bacterium]